MTDLVKQAIAELHDIVRCRCHEAYKDRGLQDPSCECDSADAVKVVVDRIEELEAENKQMRESLEHLDAGDGYAAMVARTTLAKISAAPGEWYCPCGYESPPPAPPGMSYEIEYDSFLGLETRWRLVPSTTSEGEE